MPYLHSYQLYVVTMASKTTRKTCISAYSARTLIYNLSGSQLPSIFSYSNEWLSVLVNGEILISIYHQ